VLVGLEEELGAIGLLRRHDGEPAMVAHRDVLLRDEAEDVGVEGLRLPLVVNPAIFLVGPGETFATRGQLDDDADYQTAYQSARTVAVNGGRG
jgi:L-aminopeptidase/D-esterase-like protein